MLDAAQRIIRRIALVLRARRAFLALCLSLSLWLGVKLLGQVLGFAVPLALFFTVPLASLFGFVWPLSVRWVRVGRRLGLGGKLAGLVAARQAQETAFLSALVPQISLRPWRLFCPEILALFPVLALVGLFFLPWSPSSPLVLPPEAASVEESSVETAFSSQPQREERPGTWTRVLPQLPPNFPQALSPYAELLAELFGEEVLPEEVWERLSEDESLLRRLSALLAQASVQGLTRELREEFAEIVPELGRWNLLSIASSVSQGREDQAQAPAAVAVAEQGPSAGEAPSEGRGSSSPQGEGGPAEVSVGVAEEIRMDTEAEERWGRFEEAERGLGLGAGWEKGEPVKPGTPLASPQVEEVLPVLVKPGEGPVRQGFALGLPGEAPGAEPPGLSTLSPAEAELLLVAKDLPPGLREVVRRYFQLLAEGQ